MTLVHYTQFYFTWMLVELRPFDDPWLNRLEIFNETTVLFSTYFLYIFGGLIPDPVIAYQASKFLNLILYGALAFNFLIAIILTVKQVRRDSRLNALLVEKKKSREIEKEFFNYQPGELSEVRQ